MAFNFIGPNKKLSQLIAQSWLDGERLEINKDWLIEQGLISEEEASYFKVMVDSNPREKPSPDHKYIGDITVDEEGEERKLLKYIPYPERPNAEELTDEVLEEWVNSDPNSAPWLPINPYIPYTC